MDGRELETISGDKVFTFKVPISGEHKIIAVSSDLSDTMVISKAEAVDSAYSMLKKETVVNWFDADAFKPDCYSIKDTLGTLMQNPKSAAIVGRMMEAARVSCGDMAEAAAGTVEADNQISAFRTGRRWCQNDGKL